MAHELSKAAMERARKAFRAALDAAVPAYELGQLQLFHRDEEAFIRREVEKKLFVPALPNAGEQERKWVQRLREMSHQDYWKQRECVGLWSNGDEVKNARWLCGRAVGMASAWAEMLPREAFDARRRLNPGRYYFRIPVTPKTDSKAYKWFTELAKAATETEEWEVKWFAEFMLAGAPSGVSDFVMEPICGLERWNGDVLRIVRLRNMRGEQRDLIALPADEYKSPEAFREWLLRMGNFHSRGMNQTHLQDLHEDIGCQILGRIMKEIDFCGWHQLAHECVDDKPHEFVEGKCSRCGLPPGILNGLWFYGDCVYHNGQALEADSDRIYWVNENGVDQGYFLSEKGRESEYAMGQPQLQPRVMLAELLTLKDIAAWENQPAPRPVSEQKAGGRKGEVAAKYDEMELLRTFFREVCLKFYETAGSYTAYMSIGAMFGYAAAPEIFKTRGELPGLFIHGQFESGKTKYTEWLTHLAAFSRQAGVSAIKSTTVGILQEAQNYSNLPLWIDEFRQAEVGSDKLSLIRDSFNRQPQLKWTPDGIQRKIRTAFVVSGESTSTDAATRSRFPHIQISETTRLKPHFDWFTANKHKFFVFWRYLMMHRPEFVQRLMVLLKGWMTDPGMPRVGEREKFVHGVSVTAWMAVADMLGSHSDEEVGAFYEFMLQHTRAAAVDVKAEANINIFWTDFINCFKAHELPTTCFRIAKEAGTYPDGYDFPRYVLYIDPDATLSAIAEYLRKQNERPSLKRNDLRDQLSKQPYFIPGKHTMRFGPRGATSVSRAWLIEVNEHPLGRQMVTDEELKEALVPHDPNLPGMRFRDGDPRKGPLFLVIHAVEEKEAEERRLVE